MKTLHPKILYTLPHRGVQRGVTPSAGFGGKRAPGGGSGVASPDGGSGMNPPKEKFPCKCIL
jgi:hypothetical protein